MHDQNDAHRLKQEAERLRSLQAIGKSGQLNNLFDYLVDRSAAGASPKESEIAIDVLGRSIDNLSDLDASVRVMIHRLRRKLDDHYATETDRTGDRLALPKGGYRFTIRPMDGLDPQPETPGRAPMLSRGWKRGIAMAALALASAAIGYEVGRLHPQGDAHRTLATTAPWNDIAATSSRIIVAVGSYYTFADRADDGTPAGFVHRPMIRSDADLSRFLLQDPSSRQRYAGFGTDYYPAGVGLALNAVLPIVTKKVEPPRTMQVVPMAQLTPGMIVNSDIIYLGQMDALGLLRDGGFTQSRFLIDDDGMGVTDSQSGKRYRADPPTPSVGDDIRKDYCLIRSLPGPRKGRILILAGTNDTSMIQAAELVTDPGQLARLTAGMAGRADFEALYEVRSIGNRNVNAELITKAPVRGVSWGK